MNCFLTQSFIHLPGIGRTTEQRLWQEGFESWEVLAENLQDAPVGSADRAELRDHLDFSTNALIENDHDYFRRILGVKEAWRAYDAFADHRSFLDIETDGGQSGSSITLVGLYDGQNYVCLIRDQDIHEFPVHITKSKYLVTFYGNGFDVPMLRKRFDEVAFNQIHFDLCPAMQRLGYRGGLKKIEKAIGIARPNQTVGLNGLDAIKLWNRYEYFGDKKALQLLIDYNREDVVNLEVLAEFAVERLRRMTVLGHDLTEPIST